MAQPGENPGGGPAASDDESEHGAVVALPAQWLSRMTQPDKLDLSVDRGAAFKTWKTRWTDFVTLSGLTAQPKAVQLAMLRSCLSDDTVHIVENMGLSRSDGENVSKIIEKVLIA